MARPQRDKLSRPKLSGTPVLDELRYVVIELSHISVILRKLSEDTQGTDEIGDQLKKVTCRVHLIKQRLKRLPLLSLMKE